MKKEIDKMQESGGELMLDIATPEGKVFKCISKILKANFSEASFIVTDTGIFVQENNGDIKNPKDPVTVVVEVFLKKEKFSRYRIPKIDGNGVICLGFSTTDLKDILDRVNKTDQLKIYMYSSCHTKIHFDIVGKKDTVSTKFLALVKRNLGEVIPPLYVESNPTAVIDSRAYRSTIVDIWKTSKINICIIAQEKAISIEGTGSEIKGQKDVFGTWIQGEPTIYNETLSTSRFHAFSEVSACSISTMIRIYACPNGDPLRISADAGSLGAISMYVQPPPPSGTYQQSN